MDITEAYQVGGTAVKAAFEGKTGQMVILKRVSQDPYICTTDLYDVHKVANLEKKVPRYLDHGRGRLCDRRDEKLYRTFDPGGADSDHDHKDNPDTLLLTICKKME